VSFTFSGGSIHPLLKLAETHNISTGFNTNAHLISIIRAREHQTVHSRAD
jgi:hypothetical protein